MVTRKAGLIVLAALAGARMAGLAWPAFADAPFALKEGDRVVFYGDSITARGAYTSYVETYVATRFPSLNVSFINAGEDGDQVSGGKAGTVEERLQRDVFDYNPNVVTVMLGMNDVLAKGPESHNESSVKAFADGYMYILALIKTTIPGVRLTLLESSPYDDVTRSPGAMGGNNEALVSYNAYVKEMARLLEVTDVDLNAPIVAAMHSATQIDAHMAEYVIPDRIHPSDQCGLLMAKEILKAWNAPALVSAVELDAASGRVVRQDNAVIDKLDAGKTISWTQLDSALPMPILLNDGLTAMLAKVSDVEQALNQQTLKVTGLTSAHYALTIDGREVALLTPEQLAAGVNLAEVRTPMMDQASEVYNLTKLRSQIYTRMMKLVNDAPSEEAVASQFGRLKDSYVDTYAKRQAMAKPVSHQFKLIPQSVK